MTAHLVLLTAASVVLGAEGPPFVVFGGDPARGVLVNHSLGARPDDPAVGSRPTVVFIHGFNPLPRTVHFTMAEQMAAALTRRVGPPFNVFGWNWNGATFLSLDPRLNNESAEAQGRALAEALQSAGVSPSRLHLVGHSSGCIVAASAARTLSLAHGQPIAHLTLLEPAAAYHPLVFERLAAGTTALRVENYWSPDPSAYGTAVSFRGVENHRVAGPSPYLGVVNPRRSSHMYVVRWYIATIEDPNLLSTGFNRSLLLAQGS